MRKHDLDNIRWITVVLVVLYHIVYIFNSIIPEMGVGCFRSRQPLDSILYLLYPWFMILLFVVSGASARLALEKQSNHEFLAARTRRLLVPSTIGLFVFQWIGGYVNMTVAGAFEVMKANAPALALYPIMAVSGTGVLWFIQLLWLYSVLLLLVRRFEAGRLYSRTKAWRLPALILLVVPLWAFAQVLNVPVVSVYRIGVYGFAFFLGYFIFAHDEVVRRLSRFWLPLTLAALALGIAYTWHYFGQNYAEAPVVNSPFSMLYGWTAVLAVFAVMKKFGDRTSPLAAWMSSHSFGLYVFHYLPMTAAAYWICAAHHLPAIPSYLIAGLAAFAGGWLLFALISRIPLVRWCVLGIRRKEKHHVS